MAASRSAGGAAAAAGHDFQHRVAAWLVVQMVTENRLPWDLPVHSKLEQIKCETDSPVDDIQVLTSLNSRIFIQAKRSPSLSSHHDSEFSKAIDQVVRQFLQIREEAGRTGLPGNSPSASWNRLVLAVSQDAPGSVATVLPSLLARLRTLAPGTSSESVIRNEAESDAIVKLSAVITRSWHQATSSDPTPSEILEILQLFHITVFSVEPGGSDEGRAKDLLRHALLKAPDTVDAAWSILIARCTRFATDRAGGTKSSLLNDLVVQGIHVKGFPSYQKDINRLTQLTRTVLDSMASRALLAAGGVQLHLSRVAEREVSTSAQSGHLLVIGEPGCGKTGVLKSFAESSLAEGTDVVALAVDQIGSQSLGQLRIELKLEHDLVDVLRNWPGSRPGFLIIDALDGARGLEPGRMLLDLLRSLPGGERQWTAIASVRKYDLRYGLGWQELFAGRPPFPTHEQEFRSVRHVAVGQVTDQELTEVGLRFPLFKEFAAHASGEFLALLRVPFNIQLTVDLLYHGVPPTELASARSQIELLKRYWSARVLENATHGIQRELVLKRVCDAMVSGRSLQAEKLAVVAVGGVQALTDLLSNQVLVEWEPNLELRPERRVLRFSHNILFDYAVAAVWLPGDPESLATLLQKNLDLSLVIRPSLVVFFQDLWESDPSHARFWQSTLLLAGKSGIPEIGRLIGPAVVAQRARTVNELEGLITQLSAENQSARLAAENALQHLVGELVTNASSERPLVGERSGPWCELLEELTPHATPTVAHLASVLLYAALSEPERLTVGQRGQAGNAARAFLRYAMEEQPEASSLVARTIAATCRTYQSDIEASRKILRTLLQEDRITKHGYQYLSTLANDLHRVLPFDAPFLSEVYAAAFGFDEVSQDPVTMGSGSVLTLISNRRQDYESGLYSLGELFPEFLRAAPTVAARSLGSVLERYVSGHHSVSPGLRHARVHINGTDYLLRADYSHIWDSGTYDDDEPVKMAHQFEEYLESRAGDDDAGALFERCTRELLSMTSCAIAWRILLRLGEKHPAAFGLKLSDLAKSTPILTNIDTSPLAGPFLAALHPLLPDVDKMQIEKTILSIAEDATSGSEDHRKHLRDGLLGCLRLVDIRLQEAKDLREQLVSNNATGSRNISRSMVGARRFTEDDELVRRGVNTDAPQNKVLRDLVRPLEQFLLAQQNTVRQMTGAGAVTSGAMALAEYLASPAGNEAEEGLVAHANHVLAEAGNFLAGLRGFIQDKEIAIRVRDILLRASENEEPTEDPEQDARFDEHVVFSGNRPRALAAQGLLKCARFPLLYDERVVKAINRLSSDGVPEVRWGCAIDLGMLHATDRERMWALCDYYAKQEKSSGVLSWFIKTTLRNLAPGYPVETTKLIKTILPRIQTEQSMKKVQEKCVVVLGHILLTHGDRDAEQALNGCLQVQMVYENGASALCHEHRNGMIFRGASFSDPTADAVRRRAFQLYRQVLKIGRGYYEPLEASVRGKRVEELPKDLVATLKSLSGALDSVCMQVYFASGAHDSKRSASSEEDRRLTTDERQRFLHESGDLLTDLAEVSMPRVTHHLIETLESFIPFDPSGIFLRIHRALQVGQQRGYQYDSMAASLFVRVAQRYLAEYRDIFRDDEKCRAGLREMLDLFVGWPEGRALSYRLNDLFR